MATTAQPATAKPTRAPKVKVQVINNQECQVQVHAPLRGKAKEAHEKNQTGNKVVPHGELLTLIPGMNLVDRELLTVLRDQDTVFASMFSTRIPRGRAAEHNPERQGQFMLVEGIEVDARAPLSKLDSRQALEMVGETLSEDMLERWLTQDPRAEVRELISERLKELRTEGPMRRDDAAEDPAGEDE